MDYPESWIICAGSLIVGANLHRNAQGGEHVLVDFVGLLLRVARKSFECAALVQKTRDTWCTLYARTSSYKHVSHLYFPGQEKLVHHPFYTNIFHYNSWGWRSLSPFALLVNVLRTGTDAICATFFFA